MKIGEFASLAEVTVKTLRHYHQLGLLNPAHVDPSSGYRYYTVDQLARLHSIVALQSLGLTLTEIGDTLAESTDAVELGRALRAKRAELSRTIDEGRERLAEVDFRLELLEAEGGTAELDVVRKSVSRARVLTLPIAPGHRMDRVVPALLDAIESGRVHFTGRYFDKLSRTSSEGELAPRRSIHHSALEVTDRQGDDVELHGIGWLRLAREPAMDPALTIVTHGLERDDNHVRFMLLQRWAVARGHRPTGHARIVHHVGPLQTLDRSAWVTEMQLGVGSGPVAPRAKSGSDRTSRAGGA